MLEDVSMTHSAHPRFSLFRKVLRLAAEFGAVILLTACAMPASDANRFPLYEMPTGGVRPVRPFSDQNLAWIDEERVLFEGVGELGAVPSGEQRGRALYIWNIRSGQVNRYSKDLLHGVLCLVDGFVGYSVYRDGVPIRLEGPFGREEQIQVPMSTKRGWTVNPFTCKAYEPNSLPKPTEHGGIEPLRPEHGWLEYRRASTWLRTRDDQLVQLVDAGRPMGIVNGLKYSSFSGKYVFWHPSWNQTWLVSPTGQVERITPAVEMPNDGRLEPVGQGATVLRLTRINMKAEWDAGASGLYLYTAAEPPRRVMKGVVDAMQVHRNGCLVAAILDPWRSTRIHELKVVDLCKKKGISDVGR